MVHMTYTFYPTGVCSKKFEIVLKDGVVEDISIEAGCPGSLQGIIHLVKGENALVAARKLRGIPCGGKATSCPDQLATALAEAVEFAEKERAVNE